MLVCFFETKSLNGFENLPDLMTELLSWQRCSSYRKNSVTIIQIPDEEFTLLVEHEGAVTGSSVILLNDI